MTTDADAADASTIAIVAARRDEAAGRRGGSGCNNDCHRRSALQGRRWASSLLHYLGKGRDDVSSYEVCFL